MVCHLLLLRGSDSLIDTSVPHSLSDVHSVSSFGAAVFMLCRLIVSVMLCHMFTCYHVITRTRLCLLSVEKVMLC